MFEVKIHLPNIVSFFFFVNYYFGEFKAFGTFP